MDTSTRSGVGRRVRRSPDEWRELLERFDQSNQTREKFCAEHNLGLSTFSRWRQLLRQQAQVAAARTDDTLFVELPHKSSTLSSQPWDVELQLGDGVMLRLRRSAC